MRDTGGDMIAKGFITLILACIVYFLSLAIGINNLFFSIILLIVIAVAFVVFIVGMEKVRIEQQENEKQYLKNITIFQNEYDNYINKLGVVKSDIQVTLIDVNEYDRKVPIQQYLWIKDKTLHIFPMSKYYKEYCISSTDKPDITKLKLRSIPIATISYYEEVGELVKRQIVYQEEVKVYSTAAGGMIPQMQMRTKDVVEDNRKVELVYENVNDEVEVLTFEHNAYEVLKKLIPSKDLVMIERRRRVDSIRENDE